MAAYEENYKAAQRVVEFIKAIGTVTKDSYDPIKRATDAYNALTPVQKALVPQWAIDLLEEATAKYKELSRKVADAYCSVLTDGSGKTKEEFQTAYVLPLYLNMFPENVKAKACLLYTSPSPRDCS